MPAYQDPSTTLSQNFNQGMNMKEVFNLSFKFFELS